MLTVELMNKIWAFQYYAKPPHFVEIYGEILGKHLAQEFSRTHNHSIMSLFPRLDERNQHLLVEYINQKEIQEFINVYNQMP